MRIRVAAVAILIVGHLLSADAQRAAILLDVMTVQVEPTVVPNPDKVEEDFAASLMQDSLINALKDSNFEVGASSTRAHILLEEFSSGSTAKRLLVGMGAGRSTVSGRLIFTDASGRELANVAIRVRGNLLFSGCQGGNTQRRQATNSFEQKLIEEIARLKPSGATAAGRAASAPSAPAAAPAAPPASAPPLTAPASAQSAPQPANVQHASPARAVSASPSAPPAAVPSAAPAAPPPPPPSPLEAARTPAKTAEPPAAVKPDPVAARAALEAAARAENARDWPTALREYERAKTLDPSMATFVDIALARVREQTRSTTDSDALRRARQYDALGRRAEAITWYERALETLPESDPNREVVRKRLSELKGAQ